MAQRHNNLKRLLHRAGEEVQATFDVARAINAKAAWITFQAKLDIQVMNRNGFKEPESVKNRLMRKHHIMIDFLEEKFQEYWGKYKVEENLPDCDRRLRDKIWICWWQGLDNAPEIVKTCVESIRRNAGGYEIIVITDENCKDYVQFPKWIEEKYKSGVFSRTHYSDLLRMSVLAKYGGIWIDSTFFCMGRSFENYMKMPLWSIKRPDYLHCSVASGYFAGYSLGCGYENRWMFKVIRDFLFEYWRVCDKLIDYLLVDYAVVLAQRHNEKISAAFAAIAPNNKNCDELYKVLGQPYDENLWKKISEDTVLYKLTWKQSFPADIDGRQTFYSKLMEGELK